VNGRSGRVRGYGAALLLVVVAVMCAILASRLDAERQHLARETGRLSLETEALYRRAGEIEAAAARARRERPEYDLLQERGFTRTVAPSGLAEVLADIAQEREIGRLVYDIGVQPITTESGDVGIRTVPVTLDIWATTDTDIVAFLSDLKFRIDGALHVDSLIVERTGEIDATVRAAVRDGERPQLVQAHVILRWSAVTEPDRVAEW